jgi:hypothetical protein
MTQSVLNPESVRAIRATSKTASETFAYTTGNEVYEAISASRKSVLSLYGRIGLLLLQPVTQ